MCNSFLLFYLEGSNVGLPTRTRCYRRKPEEQVQLIDESQFNRVFGRDWSHWSIESNKITMNVGIAISFTVTLPPSILESILISLLDDIGRNTNMNCMKSWVICISTYTDLLIAMLLLSVEKDPYLFSLHRYYSKKAYRHHCYFLKDQSQQQEQDSRIPMLLLTLFR